MTEPVSRVIWKQGRRGIVIRFLAIGVWFGAFYIVDSDRGLILPMIALIAIVVTIRDARTGFISDSSSLVARDRWAKVRLAWRDIKEFRLVDGAFSGYTILGLTRDGGSERLINFPVSRRERAAEVVRLLEREHARHRDLQQTD